MGPLRLRSGQAFAALGMTGLTRAMLLCIRGGFRLEFLRYEQGCG